MLISSSRLPSSDNQFENHSKFGFQTVDSIQNLISVDDIIRLNEDEIFKFLQLILYLIINSEQNRKYIGLLLILYGLYYRLYSL